MKITICGSTRFEKEFFEWDRRLTMMGHIVYTLGSFPGVMGLDRESPEYLSELEKELFDLVYLAKIEESEAIFVINKQGYVGFSTRREITWANLRNKRIYYLEPPGLTQRGYQHLPGWTDYVVKYGRPKGLAKPSKHELLNTGGR